MRVCVCESLSLVRLFATPQTVARQAHLSTGFSRQEHWSGLPCPPPGDLPNPGIKLRSLALRADSLPSEPPGKPTAPLQKKKKRKDTANKSGWKASSNGTQSDDGKWYLQECVLLTTGPTPKEVQTGWGLGGCNL